MRTESFVMDGEEGDIVTIELDFVKDTIFFTSEKKGHIKCGELHENLEAVRFTAEFAYRDTKMSFLSIH